MYKNKKIEALGYNYDSQRKQFLQHCNVCGSEKLKQLTHSDRYGYSCCVTACTACSTTFLNPRMTASGYEEFYDSVYRPLVSAYHGRLINAKTVQEDQKDYTRKLVNTLRPFVKNKQYKTLLDVGGSTGIVALGLMEEYGYKATLIDPAPDEVEEARALGIESITAFVEDWDPQGKKYDIVGIFQTIDHLLDARGTFEKLRTAIDDEGLLIFDIVDFRNAYLRHWNINEATKIDHPYYFTETSTKTLLAITGFECIHQVVSEDLLHILYICRPIKPNPGYLPDSEAVNSYLRETRFVQSTPWKKG